MSGAVCIIQNLQIVSSDDSIQDFFRGDGLRFRDILLHPGTRSQLKAYPTDPLFEVTDSAIMIPERGSSGTDSSHMLFLFI